MSTIRNGVELSWFTRLAGRANEFAQSGNVGSIGSDAGRVDRQAQALSGFYINAGIIELRQAKPNRWKHTLDSARIDRARRSVSLPRAICDCEELVPIVFVPHFSLPRPGTQDALGIRCTRCPYGRFSMPQGQTYGIRHNPCRVQHRLLNVSSALRKSNCQVACRKVVRGAASILSKQCSRHVAVEDAS